MSEEIKNALSILEKAIKDDSSYAHLWHCNIAMACKDAGASHEVGNEAAFRFMERIFNISTSNDMIS